MKKYYNYLMTCTNQQFIKANILHMKIITGIILATLILTALRPKPNCECEGSIKYYHKGTLVKEVTFKKCYYILGEDCAIVRGERVRYDSIVIRGQGKN